MVRRAGIDEAGLGPILGPLTVGGVVLDLPAEADPYTLLEEAVTRRPRNRADDRLRVDDSKRVTGGSKGPGRLESTALAFMALAWGAPPASAGEVADRLLHGGTPADRADAPWLAELDLPLPFLASPEGVELACWRLERAARAAGLRVDRLGVSALHPARFNESLAGTGNKSRTHFEAIVAVLAHLLEREPEEVVLDRTGGTLHHSVPLARAFPGKGITRLTQAKEEQGYLLRMDREREVKLWFREKAELENFEVALASCLAKYVREMFMECQNRWFLARQPGLKPTKGYYVDGLRFLADAEPVIRGERLEPRFFVRQR